MATVHVIDIEQQMSEFQVDTDRVGDPTTLSWKDSHRWRCSCGKTGPWKARAFHARQGGIQHQRQMEHGGVVRGGR